MAVEALIEPRPKSTEAVAYIDDFITGIKYSEIVESEKSSLIGSLKHIRDESINQAENGLQNAY